jgi:hypothetical protein
MAKGYVRFLVDFIEAVLFYLEYLDFVENLALVDSREVSIFYYSKLS